jgi:uncharacterized protein
LFQKILTEEYNFSVEVYDNLDIFLNADKMHKFDVIIPVWTMGEISGEQKQGLLTAVKQGSGIAGWHGGMGDSFRNDPDYQWMVGGQWVAHPGGMVDYTVNIIKPHDPIMEGITDFKMHSEQYYMHVDSGNEVLATTRFTGEHESADWIAGTIMPVVWKRYFGKGKVFYSSLGHAAAEFDIPEVKKIMCNGIQWATRD